MLSAKDGLIKTFIELHHANGNQPKISEISASFGVSAREVRATLSRIREDRENHALNFFKQMFGMKN